MVVVAVVGVFVAGVRGAGGGGRTPGGWCAVVWCWGGGLDCGCHVQTCIGQATSGTCTMGGGECSGWSFARPTGSDRTLPPCYPRPCCFLLLGHTYVCSDGMVSGMLASICAHLRAWMQAPLRPRAGCGWPSVGPPYMLKLPLLSSCAGPGRGCGVWIDVGIMHNQDLVQADWG